MYAILIYKKRLFIGLNLLLFLSFLACENEYSGCDKTLPKSRDASFSPDGKKIIFASNRNGNSDIFIMNIDGTDVNPFISTPDADHYPFYSPDGSRVVFDTYFEDKAVINIVDSDGRNLRNLTEKNQFNADPSFSPDGKEIVFYSKRDGIDQIYKMKADGSEQERLTQTNSNENTPVWSPDGSKILFISYRDKNAEIYIMNTNGSDQKRITNNEGIDLVARWSPNGEKIAFYSKKQPKSINPEEKAEITVINIDGTGRINLTEDNFHDQGPVFSPDGTKILFTSCRGNQEIYIMNVDGTDIKQLTFTSKSK